MEMTENQRRWWFATHPEFSSNRAGQRSKRFSDHESSAEALADWLERHSLGNPAGPRDSYYQYEDVLDRMDAYHRQAIEQDKKGIEPDPHTFLDIAPVVRSLAAPIQALRGALRRLAENAVVSAVKKGTKAGGPGQWVEVPRSPLGLEHQSKMSGQPITERGGKYYIKEYELHGVKFDDYKDGKLYEYKGRQGNLLTRDNVFHDWARARQEAQDQARRQAEAAQGIPLIWRVGADQVEAFKKALGNIPGILVVP